MRKLHKTILIALLLLIASFNSAFATDLFRVEIDFQNESEIRVTCILNSAYEADNYECGETYYTWDFDDGVKNIQYYSVASGSPSSVTHTYILDGTETSPFIRDITLLIEQYDMDWTEEPTCVPSGDVTETEKVNTSLLGTALTVALNTSPTDSYKVGEPIHFTCNVTADAGSRKSNLYYNISETTSSVTEVGDKTGWVLSTEYGTNKTLSYTITATAAATYIVELELYTSGELVHTEQKILVVTEDGSSGDDGGDDAGDDSDYKECNANCGPYGAYDIEYKLYYDLANEQYRVHFYPKQIYPDNVSCSYNFGQNWLRGAKYNFRANGATDFGPDKVIISYDDLDINYKIVGNYFPDKPIVAIIPMKYSDKPAEVKLSIKVVANPYGTTCHNSKDNVYDETYAEIIPLPTPNLNPDDYNQVEIPADYYGYKGMPTYTNSCYAFEVVNPNNATEEIPWVNITYPKLDRIESEPSVNYTTETREAEIRIHGGDITQPELFIDKNGQVNNYRSIWVTQPSMLTPLNYNDNEKIDVPFKYNYSDHVKYYGLYLDSNDETAKKSKYLVAKDEPLPMDLLLEYYHEGRPSVDPKANKYLVYVRSYSKFGTEYKYAPPYDLEIKYYECLSKTVSRDLSSSYYYHDITDCDIYMASYREDNAIIDMAFNYSDIVVMLMANESITFKPGMSVSAGTNFTARIKSHECPEIVRLKSTGIAIENIQDSLSYNKQSIYIDSTKNVIAGGFSDTEILLYPNPTEAQFTLEIEGDYTTTQAIAIFNNIGQIVFEKQSDIKHKNTIDIQEWPEGVYFVRVINNNGAVAVKKLVKN